MNSVPETTFLLETTQAQPTVPNGIVLPPLDIRIPAGKRVILTGLQHSFFAPYLGMLAGLDAPVSGQVKLLGKEMGHLTESEICELRCKAGFVLRGGPLLSVLNGMENLKLAARYHRISDEQTLDDNARDLLSIMPARINSHLLPAYMTRLERRLLAIARPLMLKPDILFIDSPFEGLDFQDKEYVAHFLSTIARNHSTTLLVCTDDLAFGQAFAEQIVFCDEDETLVFNSWQEFRQCSHKIITLLFEHQRMNDNARA